MGSSLESRSFILIEGREGIGKSEAAKRWCAGKPGRAFYVRLESGNDEATLYRSIARAIGTACSYTRKAVEMRARIQDALQPGHMMLVLDEAHFLFPQAHRVQQAPKRLDWLRTALVDFEVPVALISTPQYFKQACQTHMKNGWNSIQIQRRLAHTILLPEEISVGEMVAVAKRYFPRSSKNELLRMADESTLQLGFLTFFVHLRKRIDFVMSQNSSKTESACIDEALEIYIDRRLKEDACKSGPQRRHSAGKPPVTPLQPPGKAIAQPPPSRGGAPAAISRIHRAPVAPATRGSASLITA